jgi:stage V sporulation protein G
VQITEVRIKLCEENHERLLAFCSITFDHMFVIRDLKIIEGTRGMFVAMPSRKLTDRCNHCGCKNHLRARFCNGCGHKLDDMRAMREVDGRAKLHADIAHPINSRARETIQSAIAKAFGEEKERAKLPGYQCRYDDYDSDYELDDVAISYGDLVRTPPGYKAHGPHPVGQPMHATTETPAKAVNAFGEGIL